MKVKSQTISHRRTGWLFNEVSNNLTGRGATTRSIEFKNEKEAPAENLANHGAPSTWKTVKGRRKSNKRTERGGFPVEHSGKNGQRNVQDRLNKNTIRMYVTRKLAYSRGGAFENNINFTSEPIAPNKIEC